MSAVALAWFTTFAVALVVALILVIAAVLLPRLAGLRTADFYCPWTRRNVVVRFLTQDGGRPIGIVSCTAFADPRIITCGMPCLGTEKLAESAREERGVAVGASD